MDEIDHSRTKTQTPQTHGIGERFTQTRLDECDRVACRQRLSATLEDLQADLDRFLDDDPTNRPHQGRWCDGTTPLHTFLESLELAQETQIASRASTPPPARSARAARGSRPSDQVLAFTQNAIRVDLCHP